MDLVLATLETKHDPHAAKNQPQNQLNRHAEPNQPWQDEGEGDQQQQNSTSARHFRGEENLLEQKDVKIAVDKDKVRINGGRAVHRGSSGGRSHPVYLDDDPERIPLDHVRDAQFTAPAHSTSEDKSFGANSSKKRSKRLLDSSSDEDDKK